MGLDSIVIRILWTAAKPMKRKQISYQAYIIQYLTRSASTKLTTSTTLTIVEHKPSHKLPMEHLRIGLWSMGLWDDRVRLNKIPTTEGKTLKYDTEHNVYLAIAQIYHVMVQEGLELTT